MSMEYCSEGNHYVDLDWTDVYPIINGVYVCPDCVMENYPEWVWDDVCDGEEVTIHDPTEDDGGWEPTERDEWHDYDPDC